MVTNLVPDRENSCLSKQPVHPYQAAVHRRDIGWTAIYRLSHTPYSQSEPHHVLKPVHEPKSEMEKPSWAFGLAIMTTTEM